MNTITCKIRYDNSQHKLEKGDVIKIIKRDDLPPIHQRPKTVRYISNGRSFSIPTEYIILPGDEDSELNKAE
jgi:hypothetical protein